jgi:cellulose synthase/poly-beta-1,6-N-acetylglucosamine synthase-like glycosyltransferase
MKNKLSISICIPSYNEGKNIKKILNALCCQKTDKVTINKIVVVSSGSTDDTNEIVQRYCKNYPNVVLINEIERNGKASAINEFLNVVDDEVVVIESADTIPENNTIEKLCEPFINDKKIGMTGGAPIPVNDPNTFLGYIIHVWWWFHRHIPRFGEIIAYRNILKSISPTTAVDEAYIQAKLVQLKYRIIHIEEAVVHNKGPETIGDLIKQRRRIFNGHSRLYQEENIKINNMTKSSINLLFFEYEIYSFKQLIWFIGGVLIEVYARFLGAYDTYHKKINPYIWETATTTKNLSLKTEIGNELI